MTHKTERQLVFLQQFWRNPLKAAESSKSTIKNSANTGGRRINKPLSSPPPLHNIDHKISTAFWNTTHAGLAVPHVFTFPYYHLLQPSAVPGSDNTAIPLGKQHKVHLLLRPERHWHSACAARPYGSTAFPIQVNFSHAEGPMHHTGCT